MAVGRFVLTPKGRAKIAAFRRTVRAAVTDEVRALAAAGRQIAADEAPSPEQEAVLLSAGIAEGVLGPIATVGEIGTPERGRFLRENMVPVRMAIADDPIEVQTRIDRVVAGTGSPDRINPITGFFWLTRTRGMQGPTLPYNFRYLESLEFGGAWLVVPRPGTRALEPEPGVLVSSMFKTLQPFAMYGRAAILLRPILSASMQRIRARARAVGLA